MARFAGDRDMDQRELDNEFRKLPPEVRDEVRAGWRQEDASELRFEARNVRMRYRPIAEGALLFLLVNALTLPCSPTFLIGSLVAGAFAGVLWRLIREEQNLSAPVALFAWILGIWILPPPAEHLNVLFAAVLIAAISPLLARERACRGTGLL